MTSRHDGIRGRVAVVTGAAGGIGRGIAQRLASDGATVVVVDKDADNARHTVAEIEGRGGRARAEAIDLSDAAARAHLVPRVVADLHRIDILVNNAAALGARLPLDQLDAADWAAVLETNLTAPAFLSRDAAGDMVSRGQGVIVNVTSLQAQLPLPAHLAYVASKGGVSALTRALAVELAHTGVRVNAVVPGMIGSPALTGEFADAGSDGSPPTAPNLVGRLGTPEDVASAVAYLTSDEAAFVTGALWEVDGGRSLSRQPDPLLPGTRNASPNQDKD